MAWKPCNDGEGDTGPRQGDLTPKNRAFCDIKLQTFGFEGMENSKKRSFKENWTIFSFYGKI